jgi:hypothetical protein
MFARPFNARAPARGVRRVRGLSAHAEVVSEQPTATGVTAPSATRAVLLSTTSLIAPNGQPANLTVAPTSGGFKPANPLVPVTIGKDLASGVTFPGEGFGFSLQASGSDAPVSSPSGVFFGNVGGSASASDFEVNPVPSGVESYIQVRSAASRDSYTLHMNLPKGARMEIAQTSNPIKGDPPTAIEIVQGTQPLGYVYQPTAVDADGTPVPAHATIDGQNIVLTVAHRGADVHYPVLLDPLVTTYDSGACDNNVPPGGPAGVPTWAGWNFTEADTYHNPSVGWWFGEAIDNCAYFPGLYTSMPTNNPFAQGNFGYFYYAAPAGANVSSAFWGEAFHVPYQSDLIMGLYVPGSSSFESGVLNYNGSAYASGNPSYYPQAISNQLLGICTPSCDASGNDGNYALFGIEAASTVYTYNNQAIVAAGTAQVALGDDHPPTLTGSLPANTNGWVNDNNKTYTASATYQDVGLGLQSITLPGPNGGDVIDNVGHGCGDPYRYPCPSNLPESSSFTLPEGITNLHLNATDVVGNTTAQSGTSQTSTMMIDRTAPTVNMDGDLAGAKEDTTQDPPRWVPADGSGGPVPSCVGGPLA